MIGGALVVAQKGAEMEPGRRRKNAEEGREKSPGREEEKGSRALHVTSPKIGKFSILIPEVFMTSNFYLQKFSITK